MTPLLDHLIVHLLYQYIYIYRTLNSSVYTSRACIRTCIFEADMVLLYVDAGWLLVVLDVYIVSLSRLQDKVYNLRHIGFNILGILSLRTLPFFHLVDVGGCCLISLSRLQFFVSTKEERGV
jgi:hypothetical protein